MIHPLLFYQHDARLAHQLSLKICQKTPDTALHTTLVIQLQQSTCQVVFYYIFHIVKKSQPDHGLGQEDICSQFTTHIEK